MSKTYDLAVIGAGITGLGLFKPQRPQPLSPTLNRWYNGILMSPTVFRYKKYRFYFFSREEKRVHVHVSCPDGEAKFWLEPIVSLCRSYRLPPRALNELHKVVERRKDEIILAWEKYFAS